MSRWWAVLARKMQQFIPVRQQDTDTPSKEIRAPLEPGGFSQTQAHNLGRQNSYNGGGKDVCCSKKEEIGYSQSVAELFECPTTKPKAHENAGTTNITKAPIHRRSHRALAKMLWEK